MSITSNNTFSFGQAPISQVQNSWMGDGGAGNNQNLNIRYEIPFFIGNQGPISNGTGIPGASIGYSQGNGQNPGMPNPGMPPNGGGYYGPSYPPAPMPPMAPPPSMPYDYSGGMPGYSESYGGPGGPGGYFPGEAISRALGSLGGVLGGLQAPPPGYGYGQESCSSCQNGGGDDSDMNMLVVVLLLAAVIKRFQA